MGTALNRPRKMIRVCRHSLPSMTPTPSINWRLVLKLRKECESGDTLTQMSDSVLGLSTPHEPRILAGTMRYSHLTRTCTHRGTEHGPCPLVQCLQWRPKRGSGGRRPVVHRLVSMTADNLRIGRGPNGPGRWRERRKACSWCVQTHAILLCLQV